LLLRYCLNIRSPSSRGPNPLRVTVGEVDDPDDDDDDDEAPPSNCPIKVFCRRFPGPSIPVDDAVVIGDVVVVGSAAAANDDDNNVEQVFHAAPEKRVEGVADGHAVPPTTMQ